MPADRESAPSLTSGTTPGLGGFARHAQAGLMAEMEGLLPRLEQWSAAGAGGMGMVFKAWHPDLGRWVAVKVVAADGPTDADAYARFRNEAAALGKLRHPGIVAIHDYDAVGDLAWIVMDWIEGQPLQVWQREAHPQPKEAAAMMARVASAAGAAHAAGVTHRDLKPANVLVRAGDEPVLIDFGLAMLADAVGRTRLTRSSVLAGTVEYIAPEQVDRTLGDPGPATDVHACGLVLWELLSGRPLRHGEAAEILASLHRRDSPPRLPSHVPGDLAAICMKALAHRPGDRYPDGISLASDLSRHVEGGLVLARLPGPAERLWRRVRRRPTPLAAVAAVVGLALAVVSYTGRDQERTLSALIAELNRGLVSPPRTHGQFEYLREQLQKLESLAPAQAATMRGGLVKAVAGQFQRELDSAVVLPDARLEEIGRVVQRLRSLDPRAAAPLETARTARLSSWVDLGNVSAPFSLAERTVLLGGIKTRTVANPLAGGQPALEILPLDPGPDNMGRPLSPVIEPGQHVMVDMTWSFDPAKPAAMGLQFDNAEVVGSILEICHVSLLSAAQLPSAAPQGASDWVVIRLQEGKVRDVRWLTPAEVAAPLTQLTYRLEGALLTLEVNRTPFAQEHDWFRWSSFRNPGRVLLIHEGPALLVSAHMRVRPGQVGSLAEADSLYLNRSFEAAALSYRAFQTLEHADRKDEARYKEAVCLRELGHAEEAAAELLQKVAKSNSRPWCGMAALELWHATATRGDLRAAVPWMHTVAQTRTAGEGKSFSIPRPMYLELGQAYRHSLRGLNLLDRTHTRAEELHETAQALKLLNDSPAKVARQTAGAMHMAGMEGEAMSLLLGTLAEMNPLRLTPSDRLVSADCLDLVMMLKPRRRDHRTTQLLSAWEHAAFQKGEPGWAVYAMDTLRTHYERGLFLRVAEGAEIVRAEPRAPLVLRVEAGLMRVLALRAGDRSQESGAAVRQALAMLAGDHGVHTSVDLRLLLWDLLLHSLGQTWQVPEARHWLQSLVLESIPMGMMPQDLSPALLNDAAETLRAAVLLAGLDPAFQDVAAMTVFRRTMPKLLLEEGTKRLFTHWLHAGSVPLPPTAGQEQALAGTLNLLWSEMTNARLTPQVLLKLLAEWRSPGHHLEWDQDTAAWTPELRGRVAWIFGWRAQHLGYPGLAREYRRRLQNSGKGAADQAAGWDS